MISQMVRGSKRAGAAITSSALTRLFGLLDLLHLTELPFTNLPFTSSHIRLQIPISQLFLWVSTEARKLLQVVFLPSCYDSAICSAHSVLIGFFNVQMFWCLDTSLHLQMFLWVSTEARKLVQAITSSDALTRLFALLDLLCCDHNVLRLLADVFFINLVAASLAKSISWPLKRISHTDAFASIIKRQKTKDQELRRGVKIDDHCTGN